MKKSILCPFLAYLFLSMGVNNLGNLSPSPNSDMRKRAIAQLNYARLDLIRQPDVIVKKVKVSYNKNSCTSVDVIYPGRDPDLGGAKLSLQNSMFGFFGEEEYVDRIAQIYKSLPNTNSTGQTFPEQIKKLEELLNRLNS